MNKIVYNELITFHPGYYIQELLDGWNISQKELAYRLGQTEKTVSKLVNGLIRLTPEMASRLSIVFDTSIEVWQNLDAAYQRKKIEIEYQEELDNQIRLVQNLDYKYWERMQLIRSAKNDQEKVANLQRYLGVSNLEVMKRNDYLVQFRSAMEADFDIVSRMNANAWVQTAINIGRERETNSFNKPQLINFLPRMKGFTKLPFTDAIENLCKLLAECGVVFVLLPHLRNCPVNGAITWLSHDKVLIAMNDRKKTSDVFWFAFFHEIGHLLNEPVNKLITDLAISSDMLLLSEKKADDFSRNFLIDQEIYEEFVRAANFSESSIRRFAESIDIEPSIVLGRLQKDCHVPYRTGLNRMKIHIKCNDAWFANKSFLP